jgi:hypothetical protein
MMARQNSSAGCGCLMFCLFLFPLAVGLAAWGVGLLAFVMAAPAVVPYLLLTDPAQFHHDQTAWLLALGAAPLLSFVLAAGRLPRTSRATTRHLSDSDPSDPVDRWARRKRQFAQTLLLLTATSTTALVMLVRGNVATGTHAFAHTIHLLGATSAMTVVQLIMFRLWDHWSPPIGEGIGVEAVRAAADGADRQLRQVREQNHQVQQMVRTVEAQLTKARQETGFVTLRDTHHTSFRCADIAHEHYLSVQDSSRAISRIAARARATAMPRVVPLRDPQTGRRKRPDRALLRTAEAKLREGKRILDAEGDRGLVLVHTLNQRTGELRDTIRDTCGARGQRWYDDLVARRDQARAVDA